MNVIKNLFNIKGYQSVYQSKITDKRKGSGLAIYLKDVFLHTSGVNVPHI